MTMAPAAVENNPNAFAEQQQQTRDLRAQLADIAADDRGDQTMQFIEWSPGRKYQTLWSLQDGMEIRIPKYMVMGALMKRRNGRFLFTANQDEAPKFKEGAVRCFLAEGSPERESGLLAEAGLDHLEPCPAVHLRSAYSKRVHAQNRHRLSWETLREHRQEHEREETREEQRKQTAAMLQLAGSRAEPSEDAEKPVRASRKAAE
jgi:hypothetical protein